MGTSHIGKSEFVLRAECLQVLHLWSQLEPLSNKTSVLQKEKSIIKHADKHL